MANNSRPVGTFKNLEVEQGLAIVCLFLCSVVLLSNSKKTKKFQINEDNKSAQFHLKYPQIFINKNNVSTFKAYMSERT